MPADSRVIRRATSDDARGISELLRAAFLGYRPQYTTAGFRATTLTPEQIATRLSEGPTWIASLCGRHVGTVSALARPAEVYIRSMAVLPEARGNGIATSLLSEVTRFAADHGARRMTLTTTPFLDDAIRLYEREGFIRLHAPLDLHGTPLFLMVKELSPLPMPPAADRS